MALQQHAVDGLEDPGRLDAAAVLLGDHAVALGLPGLDGRDEPGGRIDRAHGHHEHHPVVVPVLPPAPALRMEHVALVERAARGDAVRRERVLADVVEGCGEHQARVPRAAPVME
ncbi:MAG: hypothetical protein ACK559_00885, partial [bacterium]